MTCDISFYITRSLRTVEQYIIYLECLESIRKSYGSNIPIIVIRDNESLDLTANGLREVDDDYVYLIDSEWQGAAESLRYYYFWKVCTDRNTYSHIPATFYAICMHDSMFIHTPIHMDHVDKYGYQDLWTAKKDWNIPKDELAMIDLVPKNKHKLQSLYKTNNWHTSFGACAVITIDFLFNVQESFGILSDQFLSQIKTHEHRVALERVWGLMFAAINYNPLTVYGDINVYHGWMVQRFKLDKDFYFKFYDQHREYYLNFPIIKCWVGR